MGEHAVLGLELLVVAFLGHFTVVEHDNVGAQPGRVVGSLRDVNRGVILHAVLQRLLDLLLLLGLVLHAEGDVVDQQDGRFEDDGPGELEAHLLVDGQFATVDSDGLAVASGKIGGQELGGGSLVPESRLTLEDALKHFLVLHLLEHNALLIELLPADLGHDGILVGHHRLEQGVSREVVSVELSFVDEVLCVGGLDGVHDQLVASVRVAVKDVVQD